jgi:hypothetical protein
VTITIDTPSYVLYNSQNARQLDRVYSVLIDTSAAKTLADISDLTGIRSESSIASRIRELRQLGHDIERSTHPTAGRGTRIFTYRMR